MNGGLLQSSERVDCLGARSATKSYLQSRNLSLGDLSSEGDH
jgi:hypothetical protein